MTTKQKEEWIIDEAKNIPCLYGEYKILDTLKLRISEIMGYSVRVWCGRFRFQFNSQKEECDKIIQGMKEHGIIKLSKSGDAFKVLM